MTVVLLVGGMGHGQTLDVPPGAIPGAGGEWYEAVPGAKVVMFNRVYPCYFPESWRLCCMSCGPLNLDQMIRQAALIRGTRETSMQALSDRVRVQQWYVFLPGRPITWRVFCPRCSDTVLSGDHYEALEIGRIHVSECPGTPRDQVRPNGTT